MLEPVFLEEIRTKAAQTIGSIVEGHDSVALLGFPDHSNVGDSAIWLGELALLKGLSIRVAYSCSSDSYRKENLAAHSDHNAPILLHGGGHFGDIWPGEMEFILRVVADFPRRRIVVMPQTMHFQSQPQLDIARRTINGHDSVTLCVRDAQSAFSASEYFDHPVVLAPDSAILLEPYDMKPGNGILYLAREDREAARYPPATLKPDTTKTDWLNLPAPRMPARMYPAALHRSKTRMHRLVGDSDSMAWQEAFASASRNALARYRLRRGVGLLASAEIIVTNRLHAHILSLLLNRTHILLDNNYGKVRTYYETWSQDLPLVHWASSPDEAFAMAEALLAQAH